MNSKANLKYVSFLSLAAALGGFLFGYDAAVISGTISQISKQFSLDEIMQGWYVGCALIGSIAGVAMGGVISDTFGRKRTLLVSAILFAVSSVWCAIASDFDHLVYARMIGGVGIGIVSIVSPLYISEISVAQYRGRMVSLYQLAVTVGFLGAYLVNFALLSYSKTGAEDLNSPWLSLIFHEQVWRSMLGMAAIPSMLFFVIIFFIPESPRWLILKKREEKSFAILKNIYGSDQMAKYELNETKSVLGNENKANWRDLLKPGITKAVLIGAAIAILGQFMGVNAVLYYGPSIFESSGLSGDDSLFYQVIVGLVNVLTTILAVFIIDKVGRKKLVYFGVSGMIISLLLIAGYFTKGTELGIPSVFLLICFLAYVFFCAISISAVIWVLLSEMYPIKVRGLAMSIAGFSLWFGTYLIGQLTPWLLKNLTSAGTFILFAVMCIPYMYIIWKLVPETTGKSLEEIEKYWKKQP
ncbi:MAG TPA: sugar porter family MFS transporter [Dysgonomonas sp.]|uniref:sugar porter family MFS transporter n=1 Tax=unclassified Dysgonomonas TaxID=2630389 RepID=UPI0025C317BC|nr:MULTISPECIES: sugar porter family MFS transporter [unclassified Dysgonomonas]HML64520.1 sugar porter family MFS transporter [Dysgonomonas sp.]